MNNDASSRLVQDVKDVKGIAIPRLFLITLGFISRPTQSKPYSTLRVARATFLFGHLSQYHTCCSFGIHISYLTLIISLPDGVHYAPCFPLRLGIPTPISYKILSKSLVPWPCRSHASLCNISHYPNRLDLLVCNYPQTSGSSQLYFSFDMHGSLSILSRSACISLLPSCIAVH